MAWANTISATSSILSAQHFVSEPASYRPLWPASHPLCKPFRDPGRSSISCRPKHRPHCGGGQQQRQQSQYSGQHTHGDSSNLSSTPTASAATRAVAAQASIRSGTTTLAWPLLPVSPLWPTFGINRFPTRSSPRSGLTTPARPPAVPCSKWPPNASNCAVAATAAAKVLLPSVGRR